MSFTLKGRFKITSPYTGKSKFDFLYKMEPDSIIEVKTKLSNYASSSNEIDIEIIDGPFAGEKFSCSPGFFHNYFLRIKVVEL